MDRHYPSHRETIEVARRRGLRTVVPEGDFQEEIFDQDLGGQGLVLPMTQERRHEALLQGINAAFVQQSLDHASNQQLLGARGQKERERTGFTGFDDSDDSDGAPSINELMYRHASVVETSTGPRWQIDGLLEAMAAAPVPTRPYS